MSVASLKKKFAVFHHISKCLFTPWFLAKPLIVFFWGLAGSRCGNQLTEACISKKKLCHCCRNMETNTKHNTLDSFVLLTSCQNSFMSLTSWEAVYTINLMPNTLVPLILWHYFGALRFCTYGFVPSTYNLNCFLVQLYLCRGRMLSSQCDNIQCGR